MLGDELGTEFCWPKEKKSKYRIAFYSISEVPFPKDMKNLCNPRKRSIIGAFVYASIYAVTLFYILGLHYKLFHFPTNGHTADIIAFLIPYLLSCIFLGIAVSTLFQRREQSIMLLLWCSIPALMLSGASVPREAMPEWLYRFGQILPSSSGVEGFIRLQSMGASFSDVLHEVRILWILTIVYGGFAAVGIHLRLKKAAGK